MATSKDAAMIVLHIGAALALLRAGSTHGDTFCDLVHELTDTGGTVVGSGLNEDLPKTKAKGK